MKYNKPSVTVLAAASTAIQMIHAKNPQRVTDTNPLDSTLSTGGSYDLDE